MTVETPPIRVRIVGATDVGLVREHNEDNFLIVDLDTAETDFSKPREYELGRRGALLVVCDGMGGAAAGEVASSMAVESMRRQMLPSDSSPPSAPGTESAGTPSTPGAQVTSAAAAPSAPPSGEAATPDAEQQRMWRKLRDAATRANQEIYEAACADIAKAGMGTTLTALLLLKSGMVVAQVGDSRAYVLRQGKLTQITHDQSLVNQLLDSGQITPEQAKLFEHSNVILQALGVQEDVEVVLSSENVRQGDRMMLCSDGLVGVVSDEEIQHIMSTTEDLGESVRKLIEKARDGGGPDNITVILAEAFGEGLMAPGPEELVLYRPLHLDGDRQPERRNWGADYGFTPAVGTNRDQGPGTPPPRWLSPVTLLAFAAVLALVVTGLVVALVVLPPRSREVICRITSEPAGLLLLVDDRQIGPVQRGGIDVKLLPGERRLALHDPVSGAKTIAHSFAVVSGQSCALVLNGPQPVPPIVTGLPDAAKTVGDGGTAQEDLHPAEPVRDAGSAPPPGEPDAGAAKPGEPGQPGQPGHQGSSVGDGSGDDPGPQQNRNNKRPFKRRIRRPGGTETPGTPPDSGTPTKPETQPGGTPDQTPGQGTTPPAIPVTPPSTTPTPTPGSEGQGAPKAATGGPADKAPTKPADKPVAPPSDKPAATPIDKPAEKAPEKAPAPAAPAPGTPAP